MSSPLAKLKRSLRTNALSWAVWIGTMGLVAYLWSDVGQRSPILGFAEGIEHRVAPTYPGRIQTIAVQLGQQVTADQVLAIIDPQQINAEIQIEKAELQRIKAAREAMASKEKLRALSAARGFAQASEGARVSLAKAQAELRIKRVALAAVSKRRKELTRLLEKRVVVKQVLVDLEVRHAALKNEVQAARAAVKLMRAQLNSATARRGALPDRSAELSVGPLEAELTVVERRLERLAAQRDGLTLRAPCEGRVSMIQMRKGEVARVGQPVVSVVSTSADRVIACVYESQATELRVGTATTLFSRGAGDTLQGHVVALGPVVEELPPRCRPQPRQPTWGRTMVIQLDEPGRLVAGQGFNVRLRAGEGEAPGGKAIAAPRGNHLPRRMTVPGELRVRSRFEPSGLTWVPRLARFVVVSDDTGLADQNDHAPWLFTVNTRGGVDTNPLRVDNAGSFNDLESVAPAPGGALYVLSSQSYSKRGKRKPSRQAFLRLAPEGRRYRVDASVRLAQLLDESGADALAGLGLEDTRRLNIEGMTATYAGGLLIGLKAPLDREGRALIWHMKTPDRLLSSGRLEDAGLSLWGKVKLRVEADRRSVPGGVAEVLELPDRSLVIAATASGIRPRQQSGSLWHVAHPKTARRVRTFAGRKPEGLALSPRPGHLVVVFDAGEGAPAWMELPWPH